MYWIRPVLRSTSILSMIFIAVVSLLLQAAIVEKPGQAELPLPTRGQLAQDVVGIIIDHLEHEFSELILMGSVACQMVKMRSMKGDEAFLRFV